MQAKSLHGIACVVKHMFWKNRLLCKKKHYAENICSEKIWQMYSQSNFLNLVRQQDTYQWHWIQRNRVQCSGLGSGRVMAWCENLCHQNYHFEDLLKLSRFSCLWFLNFSKWVSKSQSLGEWELKTYFSEWRREKWETWVLVMNSFNLFDMQIALHSLFFCFSKPSSIYRCFPCDVAQDKKSLLSNSFDLNNSPNRIVDSTK